MNETFAFLQQLWNNLAQPRTENIVKMKSSNVVPVSALIAELLLLIILTIRTHEIQAISLIAVVFTEM